jgi:hypothetical protein
MKIIAQCKLRDDSIAFRGEFNGETVMSAIDTAKRFLSNEFDHCFEADQWEQVTITIKRQA